VISNSTPSQRKFLELHTETQRTLARLGRSVIKVPSWHKGTSRITANQAREIQAALLRGDERARLIRWVEDEAEPAVRHEFWLRQWVLHLEWCQRGRRDLENSISDFRSDPLNIGKKHPAELGKMRD